MDVPAQVGGDALASTSGPPGSKTRRWIVRIARFFLLAYLVVGLVLFSLQREMIFPGRATQGRPESVVRPERGAELVTLTTDHGDRIAVLFGGALATEDGAEPKPRPTLLYFYGNGMCLRDTVEQFEAFRRLGVNVLIPEYVGYGMSDGEAGERGCYDTADAAYSYLLTRKHVDPKRIYVAGWSLGSAVAIDLASRKPVAGLASFSGFTSMTEMARRTVPFLPVSLLLRHRFDSEAKIARVTCPILIGHGRGDRMVPFAMSDRLAAAAGRPVARLSIEHADHNDFFEVGGDEVPAALARWLSPTP